jgi:hypothetical protein
MFTSDFSTYFHDAPYLAHFQYPVGFLCASLILRPSLREGRCDLSLLLTRGGQANLQLFLNHDMGLKSVSRDGHRIAIWRLTAEGFFKFSELRFYIAFDTASLDNIFAIPAQEVINRLDTNAD